MTKSTNVRVHLCKTNTFRVFQLLLPCVTLILLACATAYADTAAKRPSKDLELTPGDEIVALTDTELRVGRDCVGTIRKGEKVTIQHVQDNWLWTRSGSLCGWIDRKSMVRAAQLPSFVLGAELPKLEEWIQIPVEEAKVILGDRESHRQWNNWEVIQDGDKVRVRHAREYNLPARVLEKMDLSAETLPHINEKPFRIHQVNDGWLAGYKAGEFGAGLWWFSKNGEKCYRISHHSINHFHQTRHGIFAAEGYFHMGWWGSVIEIAFVQNRWVAKTVAAREFDVPRGVVQLDDQSFLVFGNIAWRASNDGNITEDYALTRLELPRYFSSVAREGNTVYVGYGYFVVVLDLTAQEVRYLFPTASEWNWLRNHYRRLDRNDTTR